MPLCVLTENQKDLLRSIAPGLQNQDGNVQTVWSVAWNPFSGIVADITGLSKGILTANWKGKANKADFDAFIDCEFFRKDPGGQYILKAHKIIGAVENDF